MVLAGLWRVLQSRWALGAAVLLVVALAVFVLAWLPQDAFWITDGGNRLVQVLSFERLGVGDPEIEWPGRALDPGLRFFPWGGHHFERRGDRVLSFYPPYFPLMALPGYRFLGLRGLHVLPLAGLIGVLLGFAGVLSALGLSRFRALGVLGLAVGSPFLFYGLTFWEHTLAVAFGVAAVVVLLRALRPEREASLFPILAAGLLLGLSTVLREEGYVLFVALLVALLSSFRSDVVRRLRILGVFAFGWAAVLAPFWWLQSRLYGSLLGAHAATYGGLADVGESAGRAMAFSDRIWSELGDLAFYLLRFHPVLAVDAALVVPFVLVAVAGLRRRREVSSLDLVVVATAAATAAILVALLLRRPEPVFDTLWTQGLLPHLPVLLLALLALRGQLGSEDLAVRFLSRASWLYVLLVAVPLHRDDVGIIWGPRHMLPVLPLLAALALRALVDLGASAGSTSRLRALSSIAAGLFVLGLIVAVHGLYLLHLKMDGTEAILQAVRDTPSRVVVTDAYWLPEELAALWRAKTFFFVGSDADYGELTSGLRAHGVAEATVVLSRRYGTLGPPSLLDLRARAVSAQPVATPGLGFLDVMVLRCRMDSGGGP